MVRAGAANAWCSGCQSVCGRAVAASAMCQPRALARVWRCWQGTCADHLHRAPASGAALVISTSDSSDSEAALPDARAHVPDHLCQIHGIEAVLLEKGAPLHLLCRVAGEGVGQADGQGGGHFRLPARERGFDGTLQLDIVE